MNITINKKTYVSKPLTMSITRDALKIYQESIDLLEMQHKLKDIKLAPDIDAESTLSAAKQISLGLEKSVELQERKCELLVRIYSHQFTLDDLYDNLTPSELENEFAKVIQNINGVVEKNA